MVIDMKIITTCMDFYNRWYDNWSIVEHNILDQRYIYQNMIGLVTLPTNEDVSTVVLWKVITPDGWSSHQEQVTIQVKPNQQTCMMKIEYCKKKKNGNIDVKKRRGQSKKNEKKIGVKIEKKKGN